MLLEQFAQSATDSGREIHLRNFCGERGKPVVEFIDELGYYDDSICLTSCEYLFDGNGGMATIQTHNTKKEKEKESNQLVVTHHLWKRRIAISLKKKYEDSFVKQFFDCVLSDFEDLILREKTFFLTNVTVEDTRIVCK